MRSVVRLVDSTATKKCTCHFGKWIQPMNTVNKYERVAQISPSIQPMASDLILSQLCPFVCAYPQILIIYLRYRSVCVHIDRHGGRYTCESHSRLNDFACVCARVGWSRKLIAVLFTAHSFNYIIASKIWSEYEKCEYRFSSPDGQQ